MKLIAILVNNNGAVDVARLNYKYLIHGEPDR